MVANSVSRNTEIHGSYTQKHLEEVPYTAETEETLIISLLKSAVRLKH